MPSFEPAIVAPDHPVLRSVAEPVAAFDADLRELAERMNAIRAAHGGVGIAAPQVGVGLRLFVIDDRLPDGTRSERYGRRDVLPMVVANPEIVAAAETTVEGEEGCLSLPDTLGEDGGRRLVPRPEWIAWRGRSLDGTPMAGELRGFTARVFCHEADHLDGLLIDRFPVATRTEAV